MSDEDYTNSNAVKELLAKPQSYGNGFRCCFQMIALAKELQESRANALKASAHEVEKKHQITKQIIEDLRSQVSRLEDEVLVRDAGFIKHPNNQWQPPKDSDMHAGMRFGLGAAAKLARSMS